MEAGLAREKELVAELAGMEETHVAADPKKGGKGAAKGGKPTSDETLREELDSIVKVQSKGWVLVDFPRSLSQMKLLETSLTGFESKADLPKGDLQSKFEAWA